MKIKNGFFLILSFFIAFSLWFYVFNLETQSLTLQVPIKVQLPEKYAISNSYPQKISIKFKGSRIFLSQLQSKPLGFHLKITEKNIRKDKKFTFDLNVLDLDLPLGVQVESLDQEKVTLNVDNKIIKQIKVHPIFKGDLSSDLLLLSHKVWPKKVRLSGSSKKLRKMSQWNTEPISLDGLQGKGKLKISLGALPQGISLAKKGNLNLNYFIRPKKANKEIGGVKIRFLSSRRNFLSKTKSVTLDVLAPSHEHIQNLKTQIEVIGNIPEAQEGKVRVKLEVSLPKSMHLLRIRPEYINVFVPKS